MTTLITPESAGNAGHATHLGLKAFNEREAVTALRNGSGDVELITWEIKDGIHKEADSFGQAGEAPEVALAVLGRRAVTAVRGSSGRLLLISWDIPAGLEKVTRRHDSGTLAGEASAVTIAAVDTNTVVTPVRAANGHLLVIGWRIGPDGTFTRVQGAGEGLGVEAIAVAAMGDVSSVFVTAVRNASHHLQLISWRLRPGASKVERLHEVEAGGVGEIAITRRSEGGLNGGPGGVLTAVRDAAGHLLITAWDVGSDGAIERRGSASAGEATHISVTAAGPPATYLTALRRGDGDLMLIPFKVDRGGHVARNGDGKILVGEDTTETAIVGLPDGRALTATRRRNGLVMNSWTVSETAAAHGDAVGVAEGGSTAAG